MERKQDGFSALLLVLLVLMAASASFIGWRVYEVRLAKINSSLTETTLTGVVAESPTAPTCREGETCMRAVSSHAIEALDSSGNIAAAGKTDGDGRYTLRLQPGRYTLALVPQVGLGHTADSQVDIKDGTTVHNLVVDTGIR